MLAAPYLMPLLVTCLLSSKFLTHFDKAAFDPEHHWIDIPSSEGVTYLATLFCRCHVTIIFVITPPPPSQFTMLLEQLVSSKRLRLTTVWWGSHPTPCLVILFLHLHCAIPLVRPMLCQKRTILSWWLHTSHPNAGQQCIDDHQP